ncbi:ATP-binding protein [Desulfosarcina variabilis]|uniref:ATP-binding protein n=1 Tax=Desulfosarcina variabilis TaxID=2300 RepID=UPI003AFAA16A
MKSETSGKSHNLATTLAIAFVLISLATLIIAGGFLLFVLFNTQRDAVAGRQRIVALQAANAVDGFIQEKFNVMEAAMRLTRTTEDRKRAMQVLLGLQPAFRQLLLLDMQDKNLFRVTRLSRNESFRLDRQLERAPFPMVKEGKRHISLVYVDTISSEPLVIMAVPVRTVLGDALGALVAEVNLKFMWDLVDSLEVGETGYAYVVDRDGRLIAFGDTARVLKGERLDHLKPVIDFTKHDNHEGHAEVTTFTGITGKKVVGTHVPLGTPDWAVITELPLKVAYLPVVQSAGTSAVIIIAMAILAALAGTMVARRLAVPILNLADTATRIESGQIGLQASLEGPLEVIRLAGAFNNMTERLQVMLDTEEERSRKLEGEISQRIKMEGALRENEQLLTNILESMDEGVLVLNRDFEYQIFNRKLEEILTTSRDVALGRKPWDVFPAFRTKAYDEITEKVKIGELKGVSERQLPIPSGEDKWVSENFSPLKDAQDHDDFKQIKIIKEYDESIPLVLCDGSKVQQVFLNILKNGAEAMAENTGDERPPTFILRVQEDDPWVRVEIEDNGPGMDDKTRRSIFVPFFTTKPVGQGTGLGLSVSYFIITEDHGGELGAYAADSGGTLFVIRLPKAGKQNT